MAKRRVYGLTNLARREQLCRDVMRAPAGWIAQLSEPTRSLEQNAKLWPMLEDIQSQVPDMRAFSTNDIKLRFLDALGSEMRFIPKLEGQGLFPVSHQSSALTVEQFSGLLELMLAYGSQHGVQWTDERKAA